MLHLLASLLDRPIRSAACLIVLGVLLCLPGGLAAESGSDGPAAAVRHAVARRAMGDLDRLRDLVDRRTLAADGPHAALDGELKRARSALGLDMVALRELACGKDEESTLGEALAALARYQAAWTEARLLAQAAAAADALQAAAAAVPLGERATAALASLAHAIDQGNMAAERAKRIAERDRRLRHAGVALLAAGLLLLCITRVEAVRSAGRALYRGRPRDPGL